MNKCFIKKWKTLLSPNQPLKYNKIEPKNLFEKCYDCIEDNVIAEEQAGFRVGRCNTDKAIIL